MKKMLGFAAVLSVCVNTSAYDFEANGMFYNILSQDDKTVEVTYRDTEYDSYSGDVAIPEQVTYNNETYRVTTIGHFAFNRCSELTSIAIPSSITLIDDCAFLFCDGLTAVYIDDLSAYMNIDIITSQFYSYSPLYYAYNLYLNGELVTDLVIPDGTTEIKDYVFEGGRCFKSVTIPNSVTFIGKRAFGGCTGLTAVNISDLSAWMNIDFATSASNPLYTPTNVYHDLYLNGELVIDLVIPEGTMEIKDYAFAYGNFKSVTIPGSVTSIGSGAFENCTNLTSIKIPNSVTSIGSGAFVRSGLTSVEISATSIGQNAFGSCTNLSSVAMFDGVVTIGPLAFSQCENLISVEIPGSVTSIGQSAFTNCFELPSIEIPNSVTSIGQSAFAGCTKLESVVIPNSITAIEMGTFLSCYSLASVTIPNSVTSIGVIAFRDCRSLTSLTIPNSVTTIENLAFRGCTGLTEINSLNPVPPTVTSILAFDSQNYTTATLNVPEGSLSAYQSAEAWKDFLNIREADFGGINKIADNNINVVVENGNIVIDGADNAVITVYNTNGQIVYSGTETTVGGLAQGIYIVQVGGQAFKVAL